MKKQIKKFNAERLNTVRSLINLEQNEKNGQQFVLLKSNQNIAVFNMLLTVLPTFRSEFCGLFEFGSNKSIIHKLKLNNTFTLKQLFDKLGNKSKAVKNMFEDLIIHKHF